MTTRKSIFKRLLYSTVILLAMVSCGKGRNDYRLLYWNIQNGMWDGQEDNYTRFVSFVKDKKPDICVWCEAQPIYKTGTAEKLDDIESWQTDAPLIDFWKKTASRYGHRYVFLGGHRDNYPQVITSRFPIDSIARIVGNQTDSIVSHGAGWAAITMSGTTVNIVTLHTWPHRYSMNASKEDRQRSGEAHEGDFFRAREMEYICRHTILESDPEGEGLWMMMGDFNSVTRRENWVYHRDEDATSFLTHDYINGNTPYIDVIAEREPNNFHSSTGGRKRIDYVYASPGMFGKIHDAVIICDEYTKPVKAMKDGKQISNFTHPSDHLPIMVDFSL